MIKVPWQYEFIIKESSKDECFYTCLERTKKEARREKQVQEEATTIAREESREDEMLSNNKYTSKEVRDWKKNK